ncbi:hypothetical protein BGZ88_009787 [Linnemannia elongata]|nr:hypothetical protein BGZ88_009787 [Linnemannia elongata]
MAMCEALPTLTGLGFPCQDLESYRQSIGMGTDETDAGGGVGPDTPRLGVLEFYVNHLTRLELLAYRYLQEDSLISNLHAFLTEAVHLRHLIAPKVNYWMEFLEMKGVQPPATSIMSAAVLGANNSQWSASKTKTWGWACRNLETLHLGFKVKETYTPNDHSDSSGPKKHVITDESRILFGFIARNCPQLKDLHIRKYSLDLSLEGGLCLLTQLRELERLVIWSQTKGFRLREQDVDWIGANSSNRNPNSSTTTFSPINPDTDNTKKGSRKRIKKFFRGLSSSSSSSSSSIPPKTRPQQHVPVIQKRPTEFYTNMPLKVMAVFKTDDDWFAEITLNKFASGWTNLVVATNISSTGSFSSPSSSLLSPPSPSSSQDEQQAAPLFAQKDQSAYRCWPHLRTMVWAIDPINIFHDERASKVFSKLRPDIKFKVQQYLEW